MSRKSLCCSGSQTLFFRGREATSGNTSALRRLGKPWTVEICQECLLCYVQLQQTGLSKVAGCQQESPPIFWVSMGWLLFLAFLYECFFSNYICLDWLLTLTTQLCISKLSHNAEQRSGHANWPQNHKLHCNNYYYCCYLQFSFLTPDCLFFLQHNNIPEIFLQGSYRSWKTWKVM